MLFKYMWFLKIAQWLSVGVAFACIRTCVSMWFNITTGLPHQWNERVEGIIVSGIALTPCMLLSATFFSGVKQEGVKRR